MVDQIALHLSEKEKELVDNMLPCKIAKPKGREGVYPEMLATKVDGPEGEGGGRGGSVKGTPLTAQDSDGAASVEPRGADGGGRVEGKGASDDGQRGCGGGARKGGGVARRAGWQTPAKQGRGDVGQCARQPVGDAADGVAAVEKGAARVAPAVRRGNAAAAGAAGLLDGADAGAADAAPVGADRAGADGGGEAPARVPAAGAPATQPPPPCAFPAACAAPPTNTRPRSLDC